MTEKPAPGQARNDRVPVARNPKATHDYHILETWEAGLVLTGTEVKSLRGGKAQLKDGYAAVQNGEVWLHNVHIPEYSQGTWTNHSARRKRKLLMHRAEIDKLIVKLQETGLTLVPLQLYFKDGRAKVELALARGKRSYDKRQALAERDAKREAERALNEGDTDRAEEALARIDRMLDEHEQPPRRGDQVREAIEQAERAIEEDDLQRARQAMQHMRQVMQQEQAFRHTNGMPLKIWKSAYSSGRGPGKSALFGMVAHWHVSTRIGSTTIVTANTEGQLRSRTYPEFAVWFGAAINAHWFTIETMRIVPAAWLLDLVKKLPEEGGLGIDPKYWYAAGQTWNADNPNAFAGAHNPYGMMVLMDEASGIPAAVCDVTEGFFTEVNPYRFWLMASQMRNRQGRFFEIFSDPRMGKGWRVRTLTTRGLDGVDQQKIKDDLARHGLILSALSCHGNAVHPDPDEAKKHLTAHDLTVRLAALAGSRGQDWHLLTAAAFVSTALPLIVFFSLQRFFVRGLLAGSVKG